MIQVIVNWYQKQNSKLVSGLKLVDSEIVWSFWCRLSNCHVCIYRRYIFSHLNACNNDSSASEQHSENDLLSPLDPTTEANFPPKNVCTECQKRFVANKKSVSIQTEDGQFEEGGVVVSGGGSGAEIWIRDASVLQGHKQSNYGDVGLVLDLEIFLCLLQYFAQKTDEKHHMFFLAKAVKCRKKETIIENIFDVWIVLIRKISSRFTRINASKPSIFICFDLLCMLILNIYKNLHSFFDSSRSSKIKKVAF